MFDGTNGGLNVYSRVWKEWRNRMIKGGKCLNQKGCRIKKLERILITMDIPLMVDDSWLKKL